MQEINLLVEQKDGSIETNFEEIMNAAELCHGKVPEFMNGDYSAEHDQCGDQGDKN